MTHDSCVRARQRREQLMIALALCGVPLCVAVALPSWLPRAVAGPAVARVFGLVLLLLVVAVLHEWVSYRRREQLLSRIEPSGVPRP